jgi:hypothetical protein
MVQSPADEFRKGKLQTLLLGLLLSAAAVAGLGLVGRSLGRSASR